MEKWKTPGNEGRGLQIVQPQFEILSDPDTRARRKIRRNPSTIGRIVPIYETRVAREADLALVSGV